MRVNGRDEPIDNMTQSKMQPISVRYGSLVIAAVQKTHAGTFYCTATNTKNTEKLEVQLEVIAPLTVHIQPSRQTIDLGKSTELVSFFVVFFFLDRRTNFL